MLIKSCHHVFCWCFKLFHNYPETVFQCFHLRFSLHQFSNPSIAAVEVFASITNISPTLFPAAFNSRLVISSNKPSALLRWNIQTRISSCRVSSWCWNIIFQLFSVRLPSLYLKSAACVWVWRLRGSVRLSELIPTLSSWSKCI